jgi:hypothetical protein
MSWTFERAAGKILTPQGHVAGMAYAGHGEARNNPAMEGEHGAMAMGVITAGGPLPAGTYTMTELVLMHPKTGPYSIRLKPDEATRAHILSLKRGPDSFLIHGNNATNDASEGCIISNRATREIMWKSEDHQLRVV